MHFQHGALTPYITTPGQVNHRFVFEVAPMLSPPMGERVHQDANGEVYCHGDQVTCYVGPVNNGHSDYSHHSRSGLSRPKFCKKTAPMFRSCCGATIGLLENFIARIYQTVTRRIIACMSR